MTPQSTDAGGSGTADVEAVLEELDSEPAGLENERVQFFLRHQPLILEWQSIASEAWAEVERALASLGPDLIDAGAAQAGFLVGDRILGKDALGPVLYRDAWCFEHQEIPSVGYAIGWDSHADPTGTWPKTSRPYCGILAGGPSSEVRARFRATLKEVAAEFDWQSDPLLEGFKTGRDWSVYRRFDSSDTWYQDVPNWRASIASFTCRTARLWAPVIEEGVRRHRSA
jgi:hypothetical protein